MDTPTRVALHERALMRILPKFRPARRVIAASLDATESLEVRLNTGSLRIEAIEGPRVSIRATVRSRAREIADSIRPVFSADEKRTSIAFDGDALTARTTIVTIDLSIGVPAGTRCTAHVSLGAIFAERISGTIDLYAGLGQIRATLSEAWSGDGLRIATGMGDIALVVPKALELVFCPSTSMGRVEMSANSALERPTAVVRAGMGNIRIQAA